MHVQDVFFSTRMVESNSNKWVGGPPVLLQGSLNDTSTNVIVIMNAYVTTSPSHCDLSSSQFPSHWPAAPMARCPSASPIHYSTRSPPRKIPGAEDTLLPEPAPGSCGRHARDRPVDARHQQALLCCFPHGHHCAGLCTSRHNG